MIMVTKQLLERHPDPDDETIRKELDGNICRCTGYRGIVDAVRSAATRLRAARKEGP
jgi:carbon-monoxide dehydrogenase small subunit